MRTVIATIGWLTLAQWLFIGLLHGFLALQDKRTPEVMGRLHAVPVIGGYFPGSPPPAGDPVRDDDEYVRVRMLEARRFVDLPAPFDREELDRLIGQLGTERDAHIAARSALEDERQHLLALREELDAREQVVASRQEELDSRAAEVAAARVTVDALAARQDERTTAIRDENYRWLAKVYAEIEPERAALSLSTELKEAPTAEVENRAEKLAGILRFMDSDAVGRILAEMEPVDELRIRQKMETMPLTRTGR